MKRSICIINGHPDASPAHFVPALAEAYERGAREAGFEVSRIDIGTLPVDLLHNQSEFDTPPAAQIAEERGKLAAAEHLVLVFPLWLGCMPARLKAFLEQIARNEFFIATTKDGAGWPAQKMKGKSARVIVTMGMPGFAYGTLFGGHSVKALEQGILRISGFKPVRRTILGGVEAAGPKGRAGMLHNVEGLGRRGV